MVLGPRFSSFLRKVFTLTTVAFLCFTSASAEAATKRKRHVVRSRSVHNRTVAAMVARTSFVPTRTDGTQAVVVRGGPWLSPTYADSTTQDFIDGEDLDVRRAAVEALGPYNGSVVVADSTSGRLIN